MNHIDEALKQYRAQNNAKRQAEHLAAMPEHERRRSERIKAAAESLVKASEEQKTLKLKIQEQRIRQREEARKPQLQAAKTTIDDMLAAVKFFKNEEYKKPKGTLKIKVKPTHSSRSETPKQVLQRLKGRVVGLPIEVKDQLDVLLSKEGDMFEMSRDINRMISSLKRSDSAVASQLRGILNIFKEEAEHHETTAANSRKQILSKY